MKRLMKKIVASIAVASMLLTMGAMTVLASPETPEVPTPPTPIPPIGGNGSAEDPEQPVVGGVGGGTIVVDGKVYNIVLNEISAAANTATDNTDKLIALMGNKYTRGTTLEVLGKADASLPAGIKEIPAGGIRITFNVAAVKKGDIIKILHQKHAGDWEVLDTTTDDGKVSALFTELSPVVFVKETAKTNGGSNVDPNKSPRTGR